MLWFVLKGYGFLCVSSLVFVALVAAWDWWVWTRLPQQREEAEAASGGVPSPPGPVVVPGLPSQGGGEVMDDAVVIAGSLAFPTASTR